jgi:Rrf2 family protein
MAANTRLATAIEILCVVAYKGASGTTSEIVANSLRSNSVVVLRLLKNMEREGLVELRPGKDGGIQLAREPDQITLDQIYRAVEQEPTVFATRLPGNPNCPVDSKMKGLLTPVFRATSSAVAKTLGQITLASLLKKIG